jgi:predicted transcriptional regulator
MRAHRVAQAVHNDRIMDRNAQLEGGFRRRWSWQLGKLADGAMRMFGALAKRLKYPALATVPVSAAMLSRVETVGAEQHLEDVAQLFIAGRCAQIPVMDHGVAVGVVTRDGVATALRRSGPHALVGAAPCRHVVTVAPSDAIGDVLSQLRAKPDSVALVLDHGSPVGLLTEEVLSAYAETFARAS